MSYLLRPERFLRLRGDWGGFAPAPELDPFSVLAPFPFPLPLDFPERFAPSPLVFALDRLEARALV